MKKSYQLLGCVALLSATILSANAFAQTIDRLEAAQMNPHLSLDTQGSIISFYGENYVVESPQVCKSFFALYPKFCSVTLAHLTADPGVTVKINQKLVNNNIITTITAHPDGKRFIVNSTQNGPGAAYNVLDVKSIGN